MKTINVRLDERSYRIFIGGGILAVCGKIVRSLKLGSEAYIVSNSIVKNKYASLLIASLKAAGIACRLKCVADTEKSKSLSTATEVLNDLALYDKKRQIFIIALGGGVVGDLAGFVASIYKRGIAYIQIPTTLLAQVDSAIGGKTAVDLSAGKNLVGSFHQPRAVISDVSLLASLNKRQIQQGLAEVIKYALIRDRKLFEYLELNIGKILLGNAAALAFIINRCASIKADIVSQDEREEKSLRTLLNFGHTIGHAIEAATEYDRYGHGDAVALGMLIAADISRQMKMLDEKSQDRITRLIRNAGLPTKLKGVSLKKIISVHYRDKKFKAGKNRFVLLQDIGKAKIVENVSLLIIQQSLKTGSDPIIC